MSSHKQKTNFAGLFSSTASVEQIPLLCPTQQTQMSKLSYFDQLNRLR